MSKRPDLPPHTIGKLVASSRYGALHDLVLTDHAPDVRRAIKILKADRLSRQQVSDLAYEIMKDDKGPRSKISIDPEDVARAERDGNFKNLDKLYWIFRGCLLSHVDADALASEAGRIPGVAVSGVGNMHMMRGPLRQRLGQAFYGSMISKAFTFDDCITSWVELKKAGAGGFRPRELKLSLDRTVDDFLVDDYGKMEERPFVNRDTFSRARKYYMQNKDRPEFKDNPTLAIKSIRSEPGADRHERQTLFIEFIQSRYRYNAIAKGTNGLEARWQQLQEQHDPCALSHALSSGVGVAINVFCLRDRKMIAAERYGVNFRKGEYDVAVVEGIRPTANVSRSGQIDLYGVFRRALDEEIGLQHAEIVTRRKPDDILKYASAFSFGLDLEYYQYNFLGLAVLDATTEEVKAMWAHANDKWEAKRLHAYPADREAAIVLAKEMPIWGSGAACLIGSFDYLPEALRAT